MLEPHPLNDGFTWRPHAGPFEIVTPAQAALFDAEGWFLLEDAFTAEEMDAVADAIEPIERKVEAYLRKQPGGRVAIAKADALTVSIQLVTRSELLKAFSLHPVFRALCRDLLGPASRLYWDQAVFKKPNNPDRVPWHQDNGYAYTVPQDYLTCWVALTDATLENGCPIVAPGLHLQGTLKHHETELGWECLETPETTRLAPARKGSVVVFSSLTPHLTGPNRTDETRKAYILQYAPDGARVIKHRGDDGVLQNDPTRQYLVA